MISLQFPQSPVFRQFIIPNRSGIAIRPASSSGSRASITSTARRSAAVAPARAAASSPSTPPHPAPPPPPPPPQRNSAAATTGSAGPACAGRRPAVRFNGARRPAPPHFRRAPGPFPSGGPAGPRRYPPRRRRRPDVPGRGTARASHVRNASPTNASPRGAAGQGRRRPR